MGYPYFWKHPYTKRTFWITTSTGTQEIQCVSSIIVCLTSIDACKLDMSAYLVGGWTNPSEKYARQNGIFLQIGMKNTKCLKPPPSYLSMCLTHIPRCNFHFLLTKNARNKPWFSPHKLDTSPGKWQRQYTSEVASLEKRMMEHLGPWTTCNFLLKCTHFLGQLLCFISPTFSCWLSSNLSSWRDSTCIVATEQPEISIWRVQKDLAGIGIFTKVDIICLQRNGIFGLSEC